MLADTAVDLITSLLNFLVDNAPALLTGGIQLIVQIVNGLAEAIPQLTAQIPTLVTNLLTTLIANAPALLTGGVELIGQIVVGLLQAIPQLLAQIPNLLSQAKEAFTEGLPGFLDIGKNIVNGIWAGIKAVWDQLVSWLSDQIDSTLGWLADFLGIHSPSTVTRDRIGKPMGQGIGLGMVEGIEDSRSDVEDALDPNKLGFDPWPRSPRPGSPAGGSGSGHSAVVNIYAQTVTDDTVEYIIQRVETELGDAV